jgi:hypothetical protein
MLTGKALSSGTYELEQMHVILESITVAMRKIIKSLF